MARLHEDIKEPRTKPKRTSFRAAKGDRINSLQNGEDTEGEETEYEYDEQEKLMFSLIEKSEPDCTDSYRKSDTPVTNLFQTLSEPESVETPTDQENMLEFMHDFAHRVQLGTRQNQKSRKPKEDVDALLKEFDCNPRAMKEKREKPIILKTTEDLALPKVQKMIKPLPIDPQEINWLAFLCPEPDEVKILPGEMWCLFNTGANCIAMKLSRDCPEYVNLVTPTHGYQHGHGAESACGGSIKERGQVVVDMMVNGEYYQLPVRDMDVSMPLASGMNCLSSGNNFVVINQRGGTIKNTPTGKEIPLYGRQGVYLFKATKLPPGTVEPNSELPFAKQG